MGVGEEAGSDGLMRVVRVFFEIIFMVAGSEAAAKIAAVGGAGSAEGGRFDVAAVQGWRQPPPGEYPPPLGPKGGQEAPGKRRAGLLVPMGGMNGGRMAGRARGGRGSATIIHSHMRTDAHLNLLLYM